MTPKEKAIEEVCIYCDNKFTAIEHINGKCPHCKESYIWDFDGDYGQDSVYGLQWTRTISPKKYMTIYFNCESFFSG